MYVWLYKQVERSQWVAHFKVHPDPVEAQREADYYKTVSRYYRVAVHAIGLPLVGQETRSDEPMLNLPEPARRAPAMTEGFYGDCPDPRQENDEYVCHRCRLRWDTHEERPPCLPR